MSVLAIDIGGTKTAVAVVDADRILVEDRWATNVETGAEGVLAAIAERGAPLIAEHDVTACGIGFGGQFDFESQQVLRSVHVSGWERLNLGAWMQEAFGLPTIADNDANVAALGEVRFGAGQGADDVVYCTISTGVGGAHLVNGVLQRGAHGLASEFGHLTIDPQGPMCGCGLRGCAERMLSGLWLEHDHGRPAEDLFSDPMFVHRYVEQLAAMLQQITMALDPDRIVLGGGIGASNPALAAQANDALAARLSSWQRQTPQVAMAALGGRSVLIGAGVLAKEWHDRSG